jgi:hypothetical protein
MGGIFPYVEVGELIDRSGNVLVAELPVTAYGGGNFVSASGENYDTTAYASARLGAEHLVGKSNRRLIIDGVQYTVVSCVHHKFVAQLELGLKQNLAA